MVNRSPLKGERIMPFQAVISMSGYMPESEPEEFETTEEAWTFLAGQLDRDWDNEYEAVGESTEAREAVDARFLPAHTDMHVMGSTTGTVHVAGPTDTHLGWFYKVSKSE